MRWLLATVLAGSSLLAWSGVAAADTTSFGVTADTTASSAQPDRALGDRDKLHADGAPVIVSYLRFSAAGLSGSVTGARLRIQALSSSRDAHLTVHPVEDLGWSEASATFETAPAYGEALSSVTGSIEDGNRLSFDVTQAIRGDGEYAFALVSERATRIAFAAREHRSAPEADLVIETEAGEPPPPPPPPPPASTTDPVIAAAGDIACDPSSGGFNGGAGTSSACRQMATSDLLVGRDFASVLALGDIQYEDGAYEKFTASFDPSWGRVKPLIDPVPGNHEYISRGAAGYFRYFGPAAGDPSEGYYSFEIGEWHLIALNSNCSQVGGCDAGSPQESWLRADLAAHQNRCVLAYWHHPRFSSGEHGDTPSVQGLWSALADAGADVVLAGHDHSYERFAAMDADGRADPDGLRQFVVGTGGKSHYPFSTARLNSEVRNADTFGVLELTLHPHSYVWQFIPESGEAFTDTGSTDCS